MTELLSFSVLVVITIGLTEVCKKAFKMPKRFIPLTALILGLVINLIAGGITGLGLLTGIGIGLSAVGLFDVSKITIIGK